MTRRTCRSIRLVVVASLALWVLATVLLPPLVAWVQAHVWETLALVASGVALAKYWLVYRHELSGKEWE